MDFVITFIILVVLFLIGNKFFKDRKNKKINKALDELLPGDELVLCNGMVAKFCSRASETVEVELKSGARARFMEWAILEINGKKL